jgi:hypothetical protein
MLIHRSRRAAERALDELGRQFIGTVLYRSWIIFRIRAITVSKGGCADVTLVTLREAARRRRMLNAVELPAPTSAPRRLA